ncbi:MAG: transcriptional repressor [Atopostipes sp.]|nr:transcriptional repressor [Atopostipes sp.]
MEKLSKYIDLLKEKDVRMTSQRKAVLENLVDGNKHPTVNEIYDDLKEDFPSMSVATIYNNLNFFKEAGIVKELPFGDGSSRFDLTTVDHFHTICRRCGKIEDFHYPKLVEDEELKKAIGGFKADDYRFEIIGLCEECQKKIEKD